MHFESCDFDFSRPDTTIVIAEAGVNHNGSAALAHNMIDVARETGAHIVKFQVFRAAREISRFAPKAQYQAANTGCGQSQLEMCRALELDAGAFKSLKDHCARVSMPFLCSAFDYDSVDLLTDTLHVSAIKISSSEVSNIPLLQYMGAKRIGAILSTGASTLAEVARAIEALRGSGCPELVLLHCVTSYPAPAEQVNLRAMLTLKREFGLPTGFSDHTLGIDAAIAAAALGACAVEKHFTTDKKLPGPDHRASLEPDELAALVRGVATANRTLGSAVKQPAPCELENLALIRKSLVAARDLAAGDRLERAMIEIKRPAGGVEPGELERVIGKILKRGIAADMPIHWSDLV